MNCYVCQDSGKVECATCSGVGCGECKQSGEQNCPDCDFDEGC